MSNNYRPAFSEARIAELVAAREQYPHDDPRHIGFRKLGRMFGLSPDVARNAYRFATKFKRVNLNQPTTAGTGGRSNDENATI